jgi:MGT family glycosyltransferase
MAGTTLEMTSFGEGTFPLGEWDRRTAAMGRVEGKEIYWQVLRLLLDQCRCIADELPATLRSLKLDGLVVDQLCYGTEAVAQSLKLPMAIACNALPFHRESRVPLCTRSWDYNPAIWARVRNRLDGAWSILTGWRMSVFYLKHRRSLGLGPPALSHINEIPPSLAQVAQIPEFFDFPRRKLPDHFHYTGPWLEPDREQADDFPWERLEGKPLIYASLGTLQNGVQRWYEIIAAACKDLSAPLVIGLGRHSTDAAELAARLSPGIVTPFAPQRALLARATLAITHAGLNSALEVLSAGVPAVAIPISHDQPGVAARLRRLGVARVLPAKHLSVAGLRSEICTILKDQSFQRSAAECAARLRCIDGPDLAADVIETAFRAGSKWLPPSRPKRGR